MNDLNDLKPRGGIHAVLIGRDDPLNRVLVWAFVLASASHLWLLDASQPEWMTSNIIYVLGLLVLIFGRGLGGWVLCAVALAIPLLFHRDQLSQSVFLMLVAVASSLGCVIDLTGRNGLPTARTAIRVLTILTYGFATLHKLNRDFFEPTTSCANYGMAEVFVYFGVGGALPDPWNAALPWLVVLTEGAIVVLYLLRARRVVWLLAAIFHIPLTLVMAPAFVFVVAVGHVAFLEDRDLALLGATLKRHGRTIIPASLALTAASLAFHGAWPEWTMVPREWLLWLAVIWMGLAFGSPAHLFDRDTWRGSKIPRGAKFVVVILGAGFALNGLTPYAGIQYQHAAAMLSNLRIDRGCWNSYVFPESWRLTEDYIRIDEAYFGEPGRLEEYELILKEQLWNPPQMRQMQRNWCKNTASPFYVRGSYRGRTFEIADLCQASTLPFEDDGIFGVELFPQYLRFQKNLMRECPQACIH